MRFVVLAAISAALVACKDKEPRTRTDAVALTGASEVAAAAPPIEMQAKIGMADMAQASPPPPPPRPEVTNPAQIRDAAIAQIAPSMLIRTGSASIEVGQLDPAIIKLRQMATQLGGYVANSSIAGGRDQVRSATLELKIPAARYDQAVGGLNGIGKVESVNTNVEDVGEEYVDINARVANAKRLEERLVSILATRAGRLQDVLAVERELARVREEIERYDGRLRYLKTRAAVSTLMITVHEPMPILGQTPGENPIVGAIRQAWRNFVGFVAWSIASLGVLIPVGVVLVAGWYLFRRVRGRRLNS